jgi:hypothetical protein
MDAVKEGGLVIAGNGPCNKERLAVRWWAESHGEWVRKAISGNIT